MIVYSVRVCDRKLEPSLVNLDANYTALHKPHFHLSCEREITKHSYLRWQGFSNCAVFGMSATLCANISVELPQMCPQKHPHRKTRVCMCCKTKQ